MKTTVAKRWIPVVLRVCLGMVFFYAGLVKLRDPIAFASSIASFQLVSTIWVREISSTLPFVEALAGFWLILGWRIRGPALALSLLNVVFVLALIQALARGLPIDCGCFGSERPALGSAWLALTRDLLLLSVSCYLYRKACDESVVATSQAVAPAIENSG